MVNGTILGENKIISFVIPVYNIENKYFERCLKSFINQGKSFNNIELIVVNDNSPLDENHDLCLLYDKKFSNFNYVKLDQNMGVSAARFIGLSRVKTEFVVFFDSDDFILDYKLEVLIKTIDKESNKFDIWCANENYVYENTSDIKWVSTNDFYTYTFNKENKSFGFYKNNKIGGKILRTSIVKDISMFYQKVQNYEDYYSIMCYLSKISTDRLGKINDEIFGVAIRNDSASRVVNFYEKIAAFLYYMNQFLKYDNKFENFNFFCKNHISSFQKFKVEKIFEHSLFYLIDNLFKQNYSKEKNNVINFYKSTKKKIKSDFQIKIPKQIKKHVKFFILKNSIFFFFLQKPYKRLTTNLFYKKEKQNGI